MVSVHAMVTAQAFNGLEHGMVGAQFFVRILKIVERRERLFGANVYLPVEDKYIR